MANANADDFIVYWMSDLSTTTPPDIDTETESSTCVDSSSSEVSYGTAEEDIPLFPIPPSHSDFSPIRFPESVEDFVDRLDLQTNPAWEQRYDTFVEQNTPNRPAEGHHYNWERSRWEDVDFESIHSSQEFHEDQVSETPSQTVPGVGIQATPVTSEASIQTDLTAERTTEDLEWLGKELPDNFWDPYVETPKAETPPQAYAKSRSPSPSFDDFRSPDCN